MLIRRPLIALLATTLLATSGCSDDTDLDRKDIGADGPVAEMSVQPDASVDLAPTDTRPASDTTPASDSGSCPAAKIIWGGDGGMVTYRDTSELANCSAFSLTRTSNTGGSDINCQTTIAANDSKLTALLSALALSDVQTALAGNTPFYGKDSRPVDGVAFSVTVDGKKLLVGSACGGASGCVAIPAGLSTLQQALESLTAEQRKDAACSALKTP